MTVIYQVQFSNPTVGTWKDCAVASSESLHEALVEMANRASTVINRPFAFRVVKRVTNPTEMVVATVVAGER